MGPQINKFTALTYYEAVAYLKSSKMIKNRPTNETELCNTINMILKKPNAKKNCKRMWQFKYI